MTRDTRAAAPTDVELVAYLDGELSPADSVRVAQRIASDDRLAERARHLTNGGRPFREAFEPMLGDAPSDRLDAMLTDMLARPAPRSAGWRLTARRWPAVAACVGGLLVAGAGLGRLVETLAVSTTRGSDLESDASEDWRSAAAQYLSLYTPETLAILPGGSGAATQQLAAVGEGLGLRLTPARVDLPGMTLKRADLYDYDERPLAFLAYADARNNPLALCITRMRRGGDAQRIERRQDMNVVYWSHGRHGFMLIGRLATTELQALATTLAARFAEPADEQG